MTQPISSYKEDLSSVLGQLKLAGIEPQHIGSTKKGIWSTTTLRALAGAIPGLQVSMHKLGINQEAMATILKSYPKEIKEVAGQLILSTNKLKDIQEAHDLPTSGLLKQLKFGGNDLKSFVDCWHANLDTLRSLQTLAFNDNPQAINTLFSSLRGESKTYKLEVVLDNLDRIIRVAEASKPRFDRPHNFDYRTPIELSRALAGSPPNFLNELEKLEAKYGLTT